MQITADNLFDLKASIDYEKIKIIYIIYILFDRPGVAGAVL